MLGTGTDSTFSTLPSSLTHFILLPIFFFLRNKRILLPWRNPGSTHTWHHFISPVFLSPYLQLFNNCFLVPTPGQGLSQVPEIERTKETKSNSILWPMPTLVELAFHQKETDNITNKWRIFWKVVSAMKRNPGRNGSECVLELGNDTTHVSQAAQSHFISGVLPSCW